MKTYIFATLFLLLTSCAPLSPSIPKSDACWNLSRYQSRYDSVTENVDSWGEVKTKMVDEPISSDGDELVYKACDKRITFTFDGNLLVSKRLE